MFNAYDTLNFEQRFEIDLSALEHAYLQAMQSFHPDHLQAKKIESTFQATEHAALINQAYFILKDPVKRAQHLLEIHCVSCTLESSVSTEILMQSFQDREDLEDADSPQKVEFLKENAQNHFDQILIHFQHSYIHQDWPSCLYHIEKLIFYQKFLYEAQKKIGSFEELY